MTKEEYKELIKKEEKRHKEAIRLINLTYTASNNPYTINDVVSDHYYTIQIKTIKHGIMSLRDFPQCVYYGLELRKDGKPKVKQDWSPVFQSNIKK